MTKPSIPRSAAIQRASELRTKMLKELESGPKQARRLAALFEVDSAEVNRWLGALRKVGVVSSTFDRRMDVCGVIAGITWTLTGKAVPVGPAGQPRRKVAKGRWPPPPRDPLLWALYGRQP